MTLPLILLSLYDDLMIFLLFLCFLYVWNRNCCFLLLFMIIRRNCLLLLLLFFYWSNNLWLDEVLLTLLLSILLVLNMLNMTLLNFLNLLHSINTTFSTIIPHKQLPHNLIRIEPIHTFLILPINKHTHFGIRPHTHLLTKMIILTITINLINCYWPMLLLS